MRRVCGIFLLSALMLAVLGAFPALAQPAPEGAAAAPAMSPEEEGDLIDAAQAMRRSGLVQFNFKDMDLVKFVRFMSELLQENIIVPPNITAKITIISPRPSSLSEARQIMLSTLQMYGFSLQDMGSYSIVRQGGVSPSATVSRGRSGPGYGEETVTYIVPLDYVTVESVVPALQNAFGKDLIVLPVGNNRDILLQGRATDVNKAVDLLRKMDTPQSARVSRTFTLKHGDAATVANQLNAVAQTGGPLQGLSAVAEPLSHKVIVVGNRGAIERAAKIVQELDVDTQAGGFYVYKLKNIDATAAAEQLGKVIAASALLQPNQEGKYPTAVVPDLATNSLIIAASDRQYEALVRVLEAIDVQAKQVLLRGFIAEINVTNLDRNGIDWNFLGGQIWDQFMLGGMAQVGESSIPSQFMTFYSDLSKKQRIEYDVHGNAYQTTETEPLALMYATVEMLKKYDAVNVLSVPRLMCTDNKESSFQVGQVIPVLKGSTSDLSNVSAIQNNYDYKDTGLTLTVTPHIRSGNIVALDIKQTTEDVLTATGSVTPVTAKREVNTSVVVADGETIILGGMIKETERVLRRGVPGFSSIPLIGGLFKKVSKDTEKVDFVIFLTPQIINNPDEMRGVTARAAGFMEAFAPAAAVSSDIEKLFPAGSRSVLRSLDISPIESETDRRFRELYQRSLKKKR
ncbi:MAG: type II secretion system secretin GspD [Fretibacterium sp.]|nr:type II secretion system secretin GspD [Fretibacterium sp.]